MDFICIMSYDLHGSWESFTGLHTGLNASDADEDKTLNVVSTLKDIMIINYKITNQVPKNYISLLYTMQLCRLY